VIYLTWAQAERHGMPLCAGCGAPFEPDDWELADALSIPAASLHEYQAQLERIMHGRAGQSHKWGEDLRRATAKTRDGRMTEPELAAHRVELGQMMLDRTRTMRGRAEIRAEVEAERRAGQFSCAACGTDEAMPGHAC
jgi:hypothetical protein